MGQADHVTAENRYASVSMSAEELVKHKGQEQPVWEMIVEMMEDASIEEIAKLPSDGPREHDHYVHAIQKKNQRSLSGRRQPGIRSNCC